MRNPTMPVIACQWCWQSHPCAPPLPEHAPAPPFGAPASVLEKLKLERTVGVPYGCASAKMFASVYVLDGDLLLRLPEFCGCDGG